MSLYLIFLTSFIVGLSGAASPGPLLALTGEETIKRDYKAGPIIIVGHSILEFLMVIFLILGFGEILKNLSFKKYLNITGGLFLYFFGIMTIFSSKKVKIEPDKNLKPAKNYLLILKGISVSLSNPYWTIWWITIGTLYLSFALPYGFLGISIFYTGHILSDFLWFSSVSFLIYKSKRLLNEKFLIFLSFFFGIFLIAFGIFLISKVI